MLNVNDLIICLRSNPTNQNFVIDQLWIDFYNEISDKKGKILLGHPHNFIKSVNKILKYMDIIFNTFRNDQCKYIWASVFNKIKHIALNYYVFIIDKKFLDLEFRYTPEKIVVFDEKDEALIFMGLKNGFTKEQLIRNYRMLVLKLHPDKSTGNEEQFMKLQIYKQQLEMRIK